MIKGLIAKIFGVKVHKVISQEQKPRYQFPPAAIVAARAISEASREEAKKPRFSPEAVRAAQMLYDINIRSYQT